MSNRKTAFTLIELLVVIAIIALLIAILLPSLSAARASGKSVACLANLRSISQMTQMYLDAYDNLFPVRNNAATGGGSNFNAFLPSRTILSFDRRPIEVFTCPDDREPIRDYTAGDGTDAYPDSLGIGNLYNLSPNATVRYSYGINNMTGINPTTVAEKALFNSNSGAYPFPSRTLMYADSTFFNARAHNVTVNDEPRLKGRVGNAGASIRMNTLGSIPAEYARPVEKGRRHPKGSNILFMDHHGESVTQKACFDDVLYSWTER